MNIFGSGSTEAKKIHRKKEKKNEKCFEVCFPRRAGGFSCCLKVLPRGRLK
jgi:hypothetical protein